MKGRTYNTQQSYPLEWLDMIITVTLNPACTRVDAITETQADCVCAQLESQFSQLTYLLKNKVFSLTKKNKVQLLIRHYHHAFIILLDHAIKNGQNTALQTRLLQRIQQKCIDTLDGLLSFIETRFAAYLSLDERVPATYLTIVRQELSEQIDKLKRKLQPSLSEKSLLDMLWKLMEWFIYPEPDSINTVTFREVLYHRLLLQNLDQLEESDRISSRYSLLEELLITLNFNHRSFISMLTQKTADRVNKQDSLKKRIALLALYHKEFKQVIAEPGRSYQAAHPSLQTILDNWFCQETFYLEKQLHLDIAPIDEEKKDINDRQQIYKLLCSLSEDQLGIVLKAADDLKIIISRSLSNVFNQIVPYLSTPYKEKLSADSMRSHTYSIEERDKQIVIEILQKMIDKIKEY